MHIVKKIHENSESTPHEKLMKNENICGRISTFYPRDNKFSPLMVLNGKSEIKRSSGIFIGGSNLLNSYE